MADDLRARALKRWAAWRAGAGASREAEELVPELVRALDRVTAERDCWWERDEVSDDLRARALAWSYERGGETVVDELVAALDRVTAERDKWEDRAGSAAWTVIQNDAEIERLRDLPGGGTVGRDEGLPVSQPRRGRRKASARPPSSKTPARRKREQMVTPCQSGHHPGTRLIGSRCGVCGEVVR